LQINHLFRLARAIEKRKQQKLAATSSMMKSDIKKTRTETIAIQPNSALMTEDSERPTRPPSKTIVSGEEFSQLRILENIKILSFHHF